MFGYKAFFASVSLALAASSAMAKDSLKDIEHVIIFMQENRAFDHYFGTMAGVRGFSDPNVQIKDDGKSIFYQHVDSSVKPAPPSNVSELMYFYINQGNVPDDEATQCMVAGSNGWEANHAAWNKGKNDRWAYNVTPWSLGYFRRKDLPVHFALAEEFIVGDAYYESTLAASDTNRAVLFSGTINSPGSNPGGDPLKQGGPVVDDHREAGCEKDSRGNPLACLPLKWKTVPEYLEEQNISWMVYEDTDNGWHNMLEQFEQYELDIISQGPLAQKGIYRPGLEKFFFDLKNGSLPQVSYIVPPIEISEHPPNTPNDGAWLQYAVAEALMNSDYWSKSAMFVSYDESGGFADHIMGPHAPEGTAGEWMEDPFDYTLGQAPVGPGYRVPFYIVSPWTRKGGVFTEHATHDSQILFLEKWSAAHGKNWTSKELNPWRREKLSDLVSAFDFSNKDDSYVQLPKMNRASKDPISLKYNGVAVCQSRFKQNQPYVPYGNQTELTDGFPVEKGYKKMRGGMSEGRTMVFETYNNALTHNGNKLGSSSSQKTKDRKSQHFMIHWQSKQQDPKDNRFKISTLGDNKKYLTKSLSLSSNEADGVVVSFTDKGNGKGYEIKAGSQYLNLDKGGSVSWVGSNPTTFDLYSVTY
ncbi:phospholipase C [Malassezia pachydermatis]|uniref:Putative phospholipase c n=1 Tax=Malassezia pachydermatis TaxID=77020 RepID=A0A0N0RS85_9BASI|nr:putative phospholipase c [Malassezia pachydermatis]KOS14222.1 putative phospholipase c [Malassezia pachydermatis]